MSARDTILFALTRYYRTNPDPRGTATQLVDEYDEARRTELLHTRADTRDRMCRDAYAAGMEAAGAAGRLRDFTVVWTTSDGTRIHSSELACVLCDRLVQGVPPKTLHDLNALANSHDCQNNRKDGRS